jgi:phytol kinase
MTPPAVADTASGAHRSPAPRLAASTPGVVVSVSEGDQTGVRHNEFCRKLLHISPGLLAFLLPLLPHSKPLTWEALAEITAITAVLTGVYIALKRRVERPGESDFYTTTLSYPAAVLATLFAFPGAPELAAVVLVVIAFGDGTAYLVGTRVGGARLPWNRGKTWAGTLAFVAVGGSLATIAYLLESEPGTPWAAALLCGGGAALTAAVVESLPVRLSDNLRVGATAGLTAAALHLAALPTVFG